MRRREPRVSNLAAGIIAVVVIAAACYFAFGGSVPFSSSPFVLKGVFTTATELHIPSPVRIAGVDVGQVVSAQRIKNSAAAVVTMQIDKNGLPIHADATANVRSRIFLEGNFYVDLHPGSPAAPILSSGSTLPASNTAGPVQLDRVLSSLNSSSRADLQTLLQGLGAALNAPPVPSEESSQQPPQDPSVSGLTGAQALNESLKYSANAFKVSTIVNEALLGLQPNDLNKVVVGEQEVFRGLAARPDQLASLVTTFNSTMAALAAREQDLSATVAVLPPLLRTTETSDTALDASFPPTRAFATALIPGVEQLGPTITVALPWLDQATALFSPSELGGLLSDLSPAVSNTAASLTATEGLLGSANQLALCFTHNLIPTGNEVIADPPNGTGRRVYQELYQSAVGLAGAAGNFDGNGRYIRSSAGGGLLQVHTPTLPASGPLYGNAILPSLGTRPALAAKAPPVQSSVPCFENPVPNLNRVKTGAGP